MAALLEIWVGGISAKNPNVYPQSNVGSYIVMKMNEL
jgi:hypothetical protein